MVTALSAPATFWSVFSLDRNRSKPGFLDPSFLDRIGQWARYAITIAGVGYLIYRTSAPLVEWMPFDWGSRNSDGEWHSAANGLRVILAMYGTVWALTTAESVSAKLRRDDRLPD